MPLLTRFNLLIALWVALMLAANLALSNYAATAGEQTAAPARRPAVLPRAEVEAFELHAFMHPHCPCSRATLWELAEFSAAAGPAMHIHVHFVTPEHPVDAWHSSDLWNIARSIPRAVSLADPGGHKARAVGAWTSGHVVVYDRAGDLRFVGGLTASRGHQGESRGLHVLEALVRHGDCERGDAPVYGCELFARGELQ